MKMLIGPRIILRPVEEDDLEKIVDWRNAPDAWIGFFNKFPLSKVGQGRWLESLLGQDDKLFLVICRLDTGEAIGTIGLDHIDPFNQSAEIGNVLLGEETARGQGYMAEALELLIIFSLQHLNLHRLYLHTFADNDRAIALYKKAGFQVEGHLRDARFARGRFRDVLVMSLLRTDWTPNSQKV